MSVLNHSNDEIKIIFAKKALDLIAFEGVSEELLFIINKECELPDNYHKILFKNGISDFINFLESYLNTKTKEKFLESLDQHNNLSTQKKIADAIKIRLFEVGASKPVYTNLFKYYAFPLNAKKGLDATWGLSSLIWQLNNDTSIDHNYYTKRALLHSIIVASTIFYINDTSSDYIKTKNFIDKSLEKISAFAGGAKSVINKIANCNYDLRDLPVIRLFF
jgi:ubiquinone biosynthesis protein COQ9